MGPARWPNHSARPALFPMLQPFSLAICPQPVGPAICPSLLFPMPQPSAPAHYFRFSKPQPFGTATQPIISHASAICPKPPPCSSPLHPAARPSPLHQPIISQASALWLAGRPIYLARPYFTCLNPLAKQPVGPAIWPSHLFPRLQPFAPAMYFQCLSPLGPNHLLPQPS